MMGNQLVARLIPSFIIGQSVTVTVTVGQQLVNQLVTLGNVDGQLFGQQ